MTNSPSDVIPFAQPALLKTPDTVIPALLDRMVDEPGRSGDSTAEGSIDELKKWAISWMNSGCLARAYRAFNPVGIGVTDFRPTTT